MKPAAVLWIVLCIATVQAGPVNNTASSLSVENSADHSPISANSSAIILATPTALNIECSTTGDGGCIVLDTGGASGGQFRTASVLEWLWDQVYTLSTLLAAKFGRLRIARYTILREEPMYEVREYPESIWACCLTETSGFFSTKKDTAAMRTLFRYYSGKNSEGTRMTISMPLLVRKDTSNLKAGNRFYVCLQISEEHFLSPPTPLNPAVSLERFPKSRILAAKFSGIADGQEWQEESSELVKNVALRGEDHVDYLHQYLAMYDLPQKLWRQRNEVWLRQSTDENMAISQTPNVRYITSHIPQ